MFGREEAQCKSASPRGVSRVTAHLAAVFLHHTHLFVLALDHLDLTRTTQGSADSVKITGMSRERTAPPKASSISPNALLRPKP